MKYMVKGIVWIVLITIGLLLGTPLLIVFVWWKVLIFGISFYLIGHGGYKLFRVIDKHYNT